MLASAQGRQPLLRGRHDFRHARRRMAGCRVSRWSRATRPSASSCANRPNARATSISPCSPISRIWCGAPIVPGACDYLNKAWLDYTGRDTRRRAWRRLAGRRSSRRSRALAGVYSTAFADAPPFEVEFRLRRANGEYGSMICVRAALPRHEGWLLGLSVLLLRQHASAAPWRARSGKASSATKA